MKSKVQKWGNSLGIRIPKSFAQETKLNDGSAVDISVDGDALVVRSLQSSYSLKKLINQITPENIHAEVSSGSKTGKEIW